MALKMDLHTYSSCSIGKLRPLELVRHFHDEEYSQIALTDRETVDGIAEAKIAAETLGITVHSGVEIRARYDGRILLYILGYYVDCDQEEFRARLKELSEKGNENGEGITCEEAIRLIRGAGGVPVLAHPMLISGIGEPGADEFDRNLDELLKKLKKEGLGGVECFHPSAGREQGIHLLTMAERYKLHVTQGTGYTGE